jgi:predicted nucleic acid-binding protein
VAELLILDSEALSALAHAASRARAVEAQRARAILAVAYERRALVRVPAPVLAEVCRGGARDAAIDHLLAGRGIGVVDLDARTARLAGALLARARLGSSCAVDAFVVATTVTLGGGMIATHDPGDLRRLATGAPQVRIWAI